MSDNRNDMDALARQVAVESAAIDDLVKSVERYVGQPMTAPTPPAGKRTALRLAPHSLSRGEQVIEVWCDGEFVAEIVAANGCGVRVISKYEKVPLLFAPLVLQVDIRR